MHFFPCDSFRGRLRALGHLDPQNRSAPKERGHPFPDRLDHRRLSQPFYGGPGQRGDDEGAFVLRHRRRMKKGP